MEVLAVEMQAEGAGEAAGLRAGFHPEDGGPAGDVCKIYRREDLDASRLRA